MADIYSLKIIQWGQIQQLKVLRAGAGGIGDEGVGGVNALHELQNFLSQAILNA